MNLPNIRNLDNADLLPGFDAERYPILSRHWPGLLKANISVVVTAVTPEPELVEVR